MEKLQIHLIRSPSRIIHEGRALCSGSQRCESGSLPERSVPPRPKTSAAAVNSGSVSGPSAEVIASGPTADELSQLASMVGQLVETVQELQQQQRQSLTEMQQATVELAVAAASWLTGTAIEADQFAVDDLVRMALNRLEADGPVRVHLNPQDHVLLASLLRQTPDAELLEQIVCVENPTLTRGSCRVESGSRNLVSDMEIRLEEIRRLWMENLSDTQVERRGDGTHGRSLRRFPDRRETA